MSDLIRTEIYDNTPASELREKDRICILGDPVAGIIRLVPDGTKIHALYRDYETGRWNADTFTDEHFFEVKRP